jgi:hypothetical protein
VDKFNVAPEAKTGVCVWEEIPPGNMFSAAFPSDYYIGCNQERSAGMINGRPFSYCPFCGKEIESVESQSDTAAEQKRG